MEEITPPGLKSYLTEQGDVKGMSRVVRRLLALSPDERSVLQKEMSVWVTRYDLSRAIEQLKIII